MKTSGRTPIIVSVVAAGIFSACSLSASATEFTARFPVGNEETVKHSAQSYIDGFSKPFTATPRDHSSEFTEPLTDSGRPFINSFSTQKHMPTRADSAGGTDEHIERPYSIMSK